MPFPWEAAYFTSRKDSYKFLSAIKKSILFESLAFQYARLPHTVAAFIQGYVCHTAFPEESFRRPTEALLTFETAAFASRKESFGGLKGLLLRIERNILGNQLECHAIPHGFGERRKCRLAATQARRKQETAPLLAFGQTFRKKAIFFPRLPFKSRFYMYLCSRF